MKDQQPESEASMEQILSSIRQIISADAGDTRKPATAPVASDDGGDNEVLLLTEIVEQDGRVVSLEAAKGGAQAQPDKSEPAAAAPSSAHTPTPAKAEPKPMAEVNPAEGKTTEELVSSEAAKETSRSLGQLANTIAEHQAAKDTVAEMPLGTGAASTLEDIVRELMRPMLKEWLDENLPGVVERVVRKEVQKLVRQVED